MNGWPDQRSAAGEPAPSSAAPSSAALSSAAAPGAPPSGGSAPPPSDALGLVEFGARVARAGDRIDGVRQDLAGCDPGGRVFGADGHGRLGELGRDLHRHWLAALDSRGREAAELAAGLTHTATALSRVADTYADTERETAGRFAGLHDGPDGASTLPGAATSDPAHHRPAGGFSEVRDGLPPLPHIDGVPSGPTSNRSAGRDDDTAAGS